MVAVVVAVVLDGGRSRGWGQVHDFNHANRRTTIFLQVGIRLSGSKWCMLGNILVFIGLSTVQC